MSRELLQLTNGLQDGSGSHEELQRIPHWDPYQPVEEGVLGHFEPYTIQADPMHTYEYEHDDIALFLAMKH